MVRHIPIEKSFERRLWDVAISSPRRPSTRPSLLKMGRITWLRTFAIEIVMVRTPKPVEILKTRIDKLLAASGARKMPSIAANIHVMLKTQGFNAYAVAQPAIVIIEMAMTGRLFGTALFCETNNPPNYTITLLYTTSFGESQPFVREYRNTTGNATNAIRANKPKK